MQFLIKLHFISWTAVYICHNIIDNWNQFAFQMYHYVENVLLMNKTYNTEFLNIYFFCIVKLLW